MHRPTRRRTAGLLTLAALLVLPASAGAWWDAGHETIAALAWAQLPGDRRTELADLLRKHPRYEEDFVAMMPADIRDAPRPVQDEWLFRHAAVWPDVVRDRFGDHPERRPWNRPTWHYVNGPLFLSDADREAMTGGPLPSTETEVPDDPGELSSMNVVQACKYNLGVLRDDSKPAADRAVALCWVLHLGGDMHQPMHSVAMFAKASLPQGDRGGNLTRVEPRGNLHALWDSLPGETFTPAEVTARAGELLADAELRAAGEKAAKQTDPAVWIEEGRELARWAVYTPEILAHLRVNEAAVAAGGSADPRPLRLDGEYLDRAGPIATRRVVEAGFRLGAVLAE